MIHINRRLQLVSQYIQGPKLADIGSDHAYLPIYALQHNIVNTAIAGEIIEGPFRASIKNVESYGLSELVDVRKGDGLSILASDEKVNTITICGMGGPLIGQILESGKHALQSNPRLVLQSNIQTAALRQTLQNLNYSIVDELIFFEKKFIYEIVVAEVLDKQRQLSPHEIKFGPILMRNKNEAFRSKWTKELSTLNEISSKLDEVKHRERLIALNKEIDSIKEVLFT
ncbi:tRNA (adenine(22)-N(1))-methyltransferase TrmK [Staphylococcus sp. SQ8-PEA]|uniref:tRNA (Adenine(22)-N(1))-methyltransferase TrmK n=1 Tax=Staphylococcus marylandisciuri TaxID=2981529 RepID=A0ABT2QQX4_9STAP|nr:tRNA (adenine(22)-N(1))-methyltransferase TrmK [Staphylococcus marylandisciuri]MCU5746379.1 tRNA (adenine(22)-N(1))-methyltransferase TrmK [Staphylococcus marylandisciuri]